IEAYLYREGYELHYVANGMEALTSIDALEPDVILLDVMMPQMDGIEVCRLIKSDTYWKHIPIIMVTALSSKEDLARSLDAGADDFLTKPVNGLELRARVRSMLRIKQQYDALEGTLRLREDLSNMIVHDLRSPLTSILMSSSLLIDSGLEGKNLERVEVILSSGRQLNSMINDLLILAKMQSGKMVLNLSEVELGDLATKALSQFSSVAASKKLRLRSQLKKLKHPVSVDANLLYRVLDNLLSNAIKFSPPDSTITLQVDEPSYPITDKTVFQQATIRVADEGIGISEELQKRIFEKYEVGNPMKDIPQFGLGLAFCKMVVEAHKGRIFVEENKPSGSIFTVVL
ncbi:MAG: HAMP domain-containing histidine kinase, partial [Microcoleus sp. SIO2G3]|nr:HAMP domain-containing histidine kinase [Microcoleus sp. SIO2G3]